MKILVTGAAGFIGSHLAEYFAAQGYDTFGVDNLSGYYDPGLKKQNVREIVNKGVTFIKADLTDNLDQRLPEHFDYIFHAAAQPGISASTPLKEYVRNNIFATQQLLDWALQHHNHLRCFVNIATSSVYGTVATLPEDAVPQPVSFYGTTKLAAEQLALGAQRLGKLCACSLRLYSVYGPRERPEKLYTRLIAAIRNDKPFPLHKGSETHSRSFTYVGDVVSGIAGIIGKEETVNGEIINIGTEATYTTAEGIALVEKITGKKAKIEIAPPRAGDQLRTAAVIAKARKLLDYDPSTGLETGLRQQVRWYEEHFL
ncbi:MAG: NAD-dependent epimerase/dehydratase family protein [Sinomicrobium sp.]|nr:NAD-dependent epimerase/dehydratase family protein [Sinomicrobium sp.]